MDLVPDLPNPLDAALADDRLTVVGLLAEAFAALDARTSAQLGGHGLSGVEFEVLLRLARSPLGLLRMSDLSAQTTLTSSGVTRVVDRLVDRGLVARQACATDRRTTYAVVTEAGRTLLTEVLPGHLALIESSLLEPLRRGGTDELDAFVSTLRRLRPPPRRSRRRRSRRSRSWRAGRRPSRRRRASRLRAPGRCAR